MQILLPNQLLLSSLLVFLLQLKCLERGSQFAELLSEPLILSHKRPFLVLLGRFQLTVPFFCILLRLLKTLSFPENGPVFVFKFICTSFGRFHLLLFSAHIQGQLFDLALQKVFFCLTLLPLQI